MSLGGPRALRRVVDGRAAGAPMAARARAENVRTDKVAPKAARVGSARMPDRDRRMPVVMVAGGMPGRGRDRRMPVVMVAGGMVPTVPAPGLPRVSRVRGGGPAAVRADPAPALLPARPAVVVRARVVRGTAVVARARAGRDTAVVVRARAVRGTPVAARAATGLWPEWPGPGGSPVRGPTGGVMTGPPAARGETLVGGVRRHRAAMVRARIHAGVTRGGRPAGQEALNRVRGHRARRGRPPVERGTGPAEPGRPARAEPILGGIGIRHGVASPRQRPAIVPSAVPTPPLPRPARTGEASPAGALGWSGNRRTVQHPKRGGQPWLGPATSRRTDPRMTGPRPAPPRSGFSMTSTTSMSRRRSDRRHRIRRLAGCRTATRCRGRSSRS